MHDGIGRAYQCYSRPIPRVKVAFTNAKSGAMQPRILQSFKIGVYDKTSFCGSQINCTRIRVTYLSAVYGRYAVVSCLCSK
jgi:hypothetical protein